MSTDIIRRLIEAGTPADLIADVAAALALAEAERSVLAKRRENERARKAKSRDVTGQIQPCHVTSQDTADKPSPSPNGPLSLPPAPPTQSPLNPPSPTETRIRLVSAQSEFNQFWMRYPHKVGKGAAEKSFFRARKASSFEALMAGLDAYVSGKRADCPWCNPATWLNQQRWLDEPAPPPQATPPPWRKPMMSREELRRAMGMDAAE